MVDLYELIAEFGTPNLGSARGSYELTDHLTVGHHNNDKAAENYSFSRHVARLSCSLPIALTETVHRSSILKRSWSQRPT